MARSTKVDDATTPELDDMMERSGLIDPEPLFDDEGRRIFSIMVGAGVGKLVRFRELTVAEFEACMISGEGEDWKITNAGLRRSIYEIDEQAVAYIDLMGGKLAKAFTVREILTVRQAWAKVHMPSDEELERVRDMRVG